MWKKRTVTAQNQFTDPIWVPKGDFDVSVYMTDSATVTLQRTIDDMSDGLMDPDTLSNWRDADAWSESIEEKGSSGAGAWYRVGVKTGGFISNNVIVGIGA